MLQYLKLIFNDLTSDSKADYVKKKRREIFITKFELYFYKTLQCATLSIVLIISSQNIHATQKYYSS